MLLVATKKNAPFPSEHSFFIINILSILIPIAVFLEPNVFKRKQIHIATVKVGKI